MPSSDRLTVSLTSELRYVVAAQVASGRYQTASAVVRAGLRLLAKADPPRQIRHPHEIGTEVSEKACPT